MRRLHGESVHWETVCVVGRGGRALSTSCACNRQQAGLQMQRAASPASGLCSLQLRQCRLVNLQLRQCRLVKCVFVTASTKTWLRSKGGGQMGGRPPAGACLLGADAHPAWDAPCPPVKMTGSCCPVLLPQVLFQVAVPWRPVLWLWRGTANWFAAPGVPLGRARSLCPWPSGLNCWLAVGLSVLWGGGQQGHW